MPTYRNISFATAQSLADVLAVGADVPSREGSTKELLSRVTILSRPLERYVFLPRRDANPFLQFAETIWLLAGRADVAWLARYNARAPSFSDDGMVWRGGYGPRLRQWPPGVDQFGEVRRLLIADRLSRRAVLSLFDPARDFVDSKDIPCNNWLSVMIRDDALHLNVAVRSNDAMWGFSGVNAFEWSILQEVLAFWLGAKVGQATYLASSFHLYERHFGNAPQIVERFHGVTPYDFVGRAAFATPWEAFDQRLAAWFEAEEALRANPERRRSVDDALLDGGLDLLRLKWGYAAGWGIDRMRRELAALPDQDHTAAAYQHFARIHPELLENIPQPQIAAFFIACRPRDDGLAGRFRRAIMHLHKRKDAAYGRAWKRRGERISMLPNIARKVDRLEEYAKDASLLSDESAIDTAVDLYIYVAKYRLYLAERDTGGTFVDAGAPTPLSDHEENVNTVVARLPLETQFQFDAVIAAIVAHFETLWRSAEADAPLRERIALADTLLADTEQLIAALYQRYPNLVVRFVGQESVQ